MSIIKKNILSTDFVEIATFLACSASAKLPKLNQCRVRMRRHFHFLFYIFLQIFCRQVFPRNIFFQHLFPKFCFNVFFTKIFFNIFLKLFPNIFLSKFFFRNVLFPIFFSKFFFFHYYIALLCVNWLKIINFARVIARVRMRPFQLKSGEKYRMLHRRKVV